MTDSKLKELNPFIDVRGMLRVGGRLKHATNHRAANNKLSYPANTISANSLRGAYIPVGIQ